MIDKKITELSTGREVGAYVSTQAILYYEEQVNEIISKVKMIQKIIDLVREYFAVDVHEVGMTGDEDEPRFDFVLNLTEDLGLFVDAYYPTIHNPSAFIEILPFEMETNDVCSSYIRLNISPNGFTVDQDIDTNHEFYKQFPSEMMEKISKFPEFATGRI